VAIVPWHGRLSDSGSFRLGALGLGMAFATTKGFMIHVYLLRPGGILLFWTACEVYEGSSLADLSYVAMALLK
jgi:hypothetical protein